MAGAKGIRAGRAFVEIFGDDTRLQRTLQRVQARLRAFGGAVRQIGARVAGLGAAVTAPLLGVAKVFATAGDQLNKMSIRTGISVEALSQLKFAAEQSGTSLETLGKAALRMNRRIGRIRAGEGTATQVDALEALGLSAERLSRLSPEETLLEIADAMASMEDQTQAAGLAQRAFGTQVDAILPLLLQGEKGIRALMQEADQLGLTLSGEDAQAAADLTDAMNRVTSVLKRAAVAIGSALAPMLERAADLILGVAKPIREWIDDNGKLIRTVLIAGAALVGLGTAAIVLGTAFTGLAAAVGIAGTALSVIGGILGAIFSPVGIIIAGVVALGAILVQTTDVGKRVLSKLGEFFGGLAEDAGEAFRAIGAAISSGNIRGAFEVLTSFLQLQWARLKKFLLENLPIERIVEQFFEMRTAFAEVTAGIKSLWTDMISFLSGEMIKFVSGQESLFTKFSPVAQIPGVKEAAGKGIRSVLGLEEFDADAALEEIERDRVRQQNAIGAELNRAAADIEAGRQRALGAIDDQISGARQAFEDAQRAFDEAKQTASAAAAVEAPKPPSAEDIAQQAQQAAEGFVRNRTVTQLVSTRSAEGINRILGAVQGVRQQDAQQQTAKGVQELISQGRIDQGLLRRIAKASELKPDVVGI